MFSSIVASRRDFIFNVFAFLIVTLYLHKRPWKTLSFLIICKACQFLSNGINQKRKTLCYPNFVRDPNYYRMLGSVLHRFGIKSEQRVGGIFC